jgi:hypothetical protein
MSLPINNSLGANASHQVHARNTKESSESGRHASGSPAITPGRTPWSASPLKSYSDGNRGAAQQQWQAYKVPPSTVAGHQPDSNGIYTIPSAGSREAPRNYTQVNGAFYQVTDFNQHTETWRVFDPQTGSRGPELALGAGGQWQPLQSSPRMTSSLAVQGPSGLGQKLMQANDMAINNVRQAMMDLNRPWGPQLQQKMMQLYGQGAFTREGRDAISKVMGDTLRGLEYTRSVGGANLSIYNFARDVPGNNPNGAVAGGNGRGGVDFSTGYVRDSSMPTLSNLMTHEMSHIYASTHDNWYLNGNYTRLPTYQSGGQVQNVGPAPFTFSNAVNNAATLENAVPVLANMQ